MEFDGDGKGLVGRGEMFNLWEKLLKDYLGSRIELGGCLVRVEYECSGGG